MELEKEADIELGFDIETDSQEEQEQPVELSEAGKEIISLVDSVIVSSEPSGSESKNIFFSSKAEAEKIECVEHIFTKVRVLNDKEKIEKLHASDGEIFQVKIPLLFAREKAQNALYHMSKKAREERGKNLTGLDRIIYNRLLTKVQSRQSFLTSFLPLSQDRELEKSFSITEVKEIVRESREKDFQQIEQIKNFVINMEKENKDFAEKKEKELAEMSEKSKRDIEKLNTKIKEAAGKAEQTTRKLNEQQAEINELTGQKQKALESKERVELTEIKSKYEAELAKAKDQADQIKTKDQAIGEFYRLINQQEEEKTILKLKLASQINQSGQDLIKIGVLEVELNDKIREIENVKKDREGEIKLLELNHKHQIEQRELKLRQ